MAAGSGDRRAGDSLGGRARRTPAEIFEPSKLRYTPYPQLGNNSAHLLSFSSFLNELNIKLDLAFNNVKPKDRYFVPN